MFAKINFSKLNLMDALDLAILIEIEALERYVFFTKQLGHSAPNDAASVFQTMAKNEGKHAELLSQRRQELFGDTPTVMKSNDLFDVEAPEMGAPTWNMSTFKAFQVVLSSEEKAFAFYDQALADVKNTEVRTLFAELRDEEAEHVSMVKKAIADLPPEAYIDLVDAKED